MTSGDLECSEYQVTLWGRRKFADEFRAVDTASR